MPFSSTSFQIPSARHGKPSGFRNPRSWATNRICTRSSPRSQKFRKVPRSCLPTALNAVPPMPPVDVSANKMVEKISYRGWKNAYRISNATVELIVLADVGPRIIWYGFVGGDNILHEVAADAGLSGGSQFRLYGGHRLWVSPEVERTYFPDNRPVSFSEQGAVFRFMAPPEDFAPGTNLQKELQIAMDPVGTRGKLTHKITNHPKEH